MDSDLDESTVEEAVSLARQLLRACGCEARTVAFGYAVKAKREGAERQASVWRKAVVAIDALADLARVTGGSDRSAV